MATELELATLAYNHQCLSSVPGFGISVIENPDRSGFQRATVQFGDTHEPLVLGTGSAYGHAVLRSAVELSNVV